MALMELTLQAVYFNQEIINRWNYVSSGTPAAVTLSLALFRAFGLNYQTIPTPGYPTGTVFDGIRLLQHPSVQYIQATVRDVYSNTDFYESPFVEAANGLWGDQGEANSPTLAYGFRTGRVRSDIRRGTKRFTGVPEGVLGNGGGLSATALGRANTLSSRMGAIITYDDEGNTISFAPAIVGKEKYTPDPLKPDRYAYRYYPTLAEQMEHVAQGFNWDVYNQVRTQVSRQYGRGR